MDAAFVEYMVPLYLCGLLKGVRMYLTFFKIKNEEETLTALRER